MYSNDTADCGDNLMRMELMTNDGNKVVIDNDDFVAYFLQGGQRSSLILMEGSLRSTTRWS